MINPQRGGKHVCQNSDCLKPFYDLGKIDFSCPNCGTLFDAEAGQAAVTAAPQSGFARGGRRKPPTFKIVSPETAEQMVRDAALADDDEPEDDEKLLLDADDE